MNISEIESLSNGLVIHQLVEYKDELIEASQERFLVDDISRVAIQGPTKIVIDNGSIFVYGTFITIKSSNLIDTLERLASLRKSRTTHIVILSDCIKIDSYILPEFISEWNSKKLEESEFDHEISADSSTDEN